jgi:5-carboxymethyl-2-hydroxymuconate isomerase
LEYEKQLVDFETLLAWEFAEGEVQRLFSGGGFKISRGRGCLHHQFLANDLVFLLGDRFSLLFSSSILDLIASAAFASARA